MVLDKALNCLVNESPNFAINSINFVITSASALDRRAGFMTDIVGLTIERSHGMTFMHNSAAPMRNAIEFRRQDSANVRRMPVDSANARRCYIQKYKKWLQQLLQHFYRFVRDGECNFTTRRTRARHMDLNSTIRHISHESINLCCMTFR